MLIIINMDEFKSILKFETVKTIKPFIYFTVVWIALIFLFMSLFDTILKSSDQLIQLYSTFPKELMQAFGKGIDSLTSIYGYFGNQIMLYLVLSGCIFTVFIASNSVAKEVENKSILFLLSKPVSRLQIYTAKFLAILISLLVSNLVLSVATVASIKLLTSQHGLDWGFFVLVYIALFILELFFAGLAELIGSKFGSGKAIALASLYVVASYLLNILSGLADVAKPLKYLSANYYLDLAALSAEKALKPEGILILILAVVFIIIGGYIFTKKDIN